MGTPSHGRTRQEMTLLKAAKMEKKIENVYFAWITSIMFDLVVCGRSSRWDTVIFHLKCLLSFPRYFSSYFMAIDVPFVDCLDTINFFPFSFILVF